MENIIPYLISPPFFGWLFALKIIFIVFSLAVIGFIIFVMVRTTWLRRMYLWDAQEILTYRPFGVRRILKEWNRTKARLDTGLEAEYKLAVIEADAMVDDILKRMGYGGETLGERLDRLTTASLPNLEQARAAHQTRNNIVHDPDFKISREEAEGNISLYEKALRDLNALS